MYIISNISVKITSQSVFQRCHFYINNLPHMQIMTAHLKWHKTSHHSSSKTLLSLAHMSWMTVMVICMHITQTYELLWTVVNMAFWLTSALDTSTLRYSLLYETKMHWEDGEVQMNLWTYGFNFLNNTEINTSTNNNNNKNDCHCIITKYQSKQILQLFSELDSHFCEPVFFSVFLLTWCQVEFSVWSGCSDSCQVFTLSVQRRV